MLVNGEDKERVRDLTSVTAQRLLAAAPRAFRGFTEQDEPNFSFRHPPCSFYSGTKALAEEALCEDENVYVWRLRIPFNNVDHPRNYLSKLQTYAKVYDNVNSLSHLDDFAEACVALWRCNAPFGTYNVTNPGFIAAHEVVELIQRYLRTNREFEFWKSDAEFYQCAARALRSNCILDSCKLAKAGVPLRCVQDAITDSLEKWRWRTEE